MGNTMSEEDMIYAFNEWMRRYVEEPDAFEQEWASIKEFLAEDQADDASYGQSCAAYMFKVLSER